MKKTHHVSRLGSFIRASAVFLLTGAGMCGVRAETADEVFASLRAKADRRIAEIRATPNITVPAGAPVYYLSERTGRDDADGRTPATAWKTIARLNKASVKPGSYVLFERGGLYRGCVMARSGVTYTAWGKGPKPLVYGSPANGADPAKWERTDNPNVWAYAIGHDDVGTLVFDDGASHALKIVIRTDKKTGAKFNKYTGKPFNSYRDLDGDLHFWHDYYKNGTGKVYLYSEKNPGERFKSIEFNVKTCGFRVGGEAGVTIDNFTVKYVGIHGVSAGTCVNLKVTNCEFAWIGGSIQGEAIFGRDYPTRLGNGVEIYGGCDGYVVENCYIWQIYDAGVTHQVNVPKKAGMKRYDQKNVRYSRNVFEKCNYSIEYFLTARDGNPSRMENVLFEDNLMFDSGYGFCEQRPDRNCAAHIKAWYHGERNRAKNYVIRNNAMCFGMDVLVQVCAGLKNPDGSSSLPSMEGNVFIGRTGDMFGTVSETSGRSLAYGPECNAFLDKFGKGNRCLFMECRNVFRDGRSLVETEGKTVVKLDRPDATYQCGRNAEFTVTVPGKDGKKATEGKVFWRLDNFGSNVVSEGTVDLSKTNPFKVTGTLHKPGFLRLSVRDENKRRLRSYSAAYEPEKIRVAVPKPADFDKFWDDAAARLEREVPLDPKMELVNDKGGVNVYHVSFATFGGKRVYGILTCPADASKGPYPVHVNCPGAGAGFTLGGSGPRDRIVLRMNVHNFPIPRDDAERKAAYAAQEARYRAVHGPNNARAYPVGGLTVSREDAHYFAVILGINRAVNWVAKRPDADLKHFTYSGSSQGGGFGLYLTGLNRHFTRAYYGVPALADVMGCKAGGRQSGWPRILEFETQKDPARLAVIEKNAPYFDAVYFAERVKIPIRMSVGYSDDSCAPHAVLSAFNAIPSGDKKLYHGIGGEHGSRNSPSDEITKWLHDRNAADIKISCRDFTLTVGDDATVKSLKVNATGEECIDAAQMLPLFTVTQDRPFNNEIKLIHPNKRTVYPACSLRREGDFLIAGFPHRQYEAKVALKTAPGYVAFTLVDFICDRKTTYDYLRMDIPPVASFRVLQLAVKNRKNFGDWLNASWDDKAAIGVAGTSPYPDIDHERRIGSKILFGEVYAGLKLRGAGAALIAAPGREAFLDAMDALERDFDMPRGVESRRGAAVKESIFHLSGNVTPGLMDEIIGYAKKGGFRLMTFGQGHITKEIGSWGRFGDYEWRDDFPRRGADLKAMLAKVKAAGISPGLHTLHSHIGLKSRYVTPVADPRLNKTRRFTLAAPLSADTNVTEITVYESTADTVMYKPCRVLQFGGELFSYESYTTEPPYRFLGVKRGAHATRVTAHPKGEIGGILDISEYGTPMSCYLDQNTDLQDEVAAKIAEIYNCGFEYVYLDGSEGVNRPFNFHVGNAQYRLWKQLKPEPLFGEGAAKTHFGWHMLAGANAFDCFGPSVFKEKLREYPFKQAPITQQDMSRVDFGWWAFRAPGENDWRGDNIGVQVDMWEYGASVAAAWDCAISILMPLPALRKHARTDDILETMRRWGDVRRRGLFREEWRGPLKNCNQEHHLLINAAGGYDLVPYFMASDGQRKELPVRSYVFEKDGFTWMVYWHVAGSGSFKLPLASDGLALFDEFAGKAVKFGSSPDGAVLPCGNRMYLRTTATRAQVEAAMRRAVYVPAGR